MDSYEGVGLQEVEELPSDSSDPKVVKGAIKKSKEREEVALEGLRTMMSHEPGRAWLYKILSLTSVSQNPFTSDPLRTAFACGEMNIGQQMMSDMQVVSFELYMLMLKENDK